MVFFSKKQRYLRKTRKNDPKAVIEGLRGLLALQTELDYSIDVKHILLIKDHAVLNLLGDYIFSFLHEQPSLLGDVWEVIDDETFFTGAALVIKRLERLSEDKYLTQIQGALPLEEAAELIKLNPSTIKAWTKKGVLPLLEEKDSELIPTRELYRLIFEQTSLAHNGDLCESCVFSCKKRVPRDVEIALPNNEVITQLCSWFKEKGVYDITRSLCNFCKKDCEDLFPRAELKGNLLVSICEEFDPKSGWESAKFAKI